MYSSTHTHTHTQLQLKANHSKQQMSIEKFHQREKA